MKNLIALSLITLCLLASCTNSDNTNSQEDKQSNKEEVIPEGIHKIVVTEELSSGGYIYIKVLESEKEYWMAIPGRLIEVGATYYYDGGMEMRNFVSKTLERTFESIIFAEGIREQIHAVKKVERKSIQRGETSVTNVEKAPNGIRIAELFENPKSYSNKEVIIKGEVVKVNNGVMNTNFVHLQDGTTGNGQYDLTITTNDEFKVGEVVTIKGSVILNKDFGAGYVYDVLVEKVVIL